MEHRELRAGRRLAVAGGMSNATSLKLSGSGKPLRISPITDLQGQVTLEAWVRPDNTERRAVLSIGDGGCFLVLAVGGGEVTALAVQNDKVTVLCTGGGQVGVGQWHHVALTASLARPNEPNSKVTVAVYHQGKAVASRGLAQYIGRTTIPTAEHALVAGILVSRFLETCFIGGVPGVVPVWLGAVSEARIWSTAAAADVEARSRLRARGDEPGLAACYRLEGFGSGCIHDISARRGFGVPRGNATVIRISDLPLPATHGADQVRLRVRGKLVRERIVICTSGQLQRPSSAVSAIVGNTTSGIALSSERYERREVTVFDATLEPRTADGNAIIGATIEVRLDEAMQALVERGGKTTLVSWAAGQTYSVTVPASGKARLRFVASRLSCPTVRARVPGMPEGVWTPVRPDMSAHRKLRAVTGEDLLRPAGGRPSPMPDGATVDDAASLASALRTLTQTMAQAAAVSAGANAKSLVKPQQRLDLVGTIGGWAEDGYEYGSDLVDDTIDGGEDTYSDMSDGVQDSLGPLEDMFHRGEDTLHDVTRVAKSAAELVIKPGPALDSLREQAAQAAPQLGTQAIATLIDAADTLAVVATTGAEKIARVIEVVGTSIVDGATMTWRVVVSGVNDAITAAAALIKRTGAEIQKFVDYLAYLFDWPAFLAASDEAYAYYERQIGELSGYISGLASFKAKIAEQLNLPIPPSITSQSISQLCGLGVKDASSLDEIDYVFELLQKAFDGASDAFSHALKGAVGSDLDLQALAADADLTTSQIGVERFTSPSKLLTVPVGDLVGNASGMSSTSTSLIDVVFQPIEQAADSVVIDGPELLRKRLNVPHVTAWIEDTILGGRTLSILRMVSLVAGILSVLSAKIGKTASSGSLDTRSVVIQPSTDAMTRSGSSSGHTDDNSEWFVLAMGLGGTFFLGLQTAYELANPGEGRSNTVTGVLNSLSMAYAIMSTLKTCGQLVVVKRLPDETRPYAIALISFDAVAAAWVAFSCYLRFKALVARDSGALALLDKIDAGVLGVLAVGGAVTGLVALGEGVLDTEGERTSFGIRIGASLATALSRFWSRVDDCFEDKRVKAVTVGLLVLSAGADITDAVYGHVNDLREA